MEKYECVIATVPVTGMSENEWRLAAVGCDMLTSAVIPILN